jgi:tetratricopeptide (TPR) repeat protein
MIENTITRENGFTMNRVTCSCDLRNSLFAVVSRLVTLLLIYGNSFFGEWHFDDFNNIVENRAVHVKGLSWEEIQKTFYGVSYGSERQRISRPLAYLSFGLNYFFGGTEVFGYHVVNFVIHWITSVFLFLFIQNTLKLPLLWDRYGQSAYGIALLSAFLWATSPLQVNAVTYIVQRMTSMAGLGYVMTLYFYQSARMAEAIGRRVLSFSLCFLSAILAVGSKENALMLPISIILYDVMLIQGVTRESLLRMLKYTWIPMTVLVLLVVIYADPTRLMNAYSVRPFTLTERLLTEPRILIFYITLLLYPLPSRLTLLHDVEISRSLFEPWTTLPAMLAVALFCVAAVALARKKPLLSYCVLFFFLNHLIEGTVIPLELIYEHRNYIPSMLLFVAIAVLMVRCLDYFSYRKGFQVFMAGGFALLLAFQGHTTFERNAVVRSDVHLWLDNVRKAPGLSRPHINLARHYYEAGMYEEALRELQTAEDLNRDTNLKQIGIASYNLGIYYLDQAKDIDRAQQQFLKALARYPDYPPAIVGLATIHLKRGEIEKAWMLMRENEPRHRNNVEMINAYALVLLKKGNPKGALKAAARSIELKWDDPKPWEISGEAWRKLGQWQKAAHCWEEVLRLSPGNPRAQLALVELYDRLKDGPALARMAGRCWALKSAEPLDKWLAELAANPGASAYEVNPGMLGRIIRREISRELARLDLSQ